MVVKKIEETVERARKYQSTNGPKEWSKSNEKTSMQTTEFVESNKSNDSFSEWNEEDEYEKEIPSHDDHQKEFKVLGQREFKSLSKITVTCSWIEDAFVFPSELENNNLSELNTVYGIPQPFLIKVEQNIKYWFPVQRSVLPVLLRDIENHPVLRPRDITISAPTGSGKTLCYVLPILAAVGERPTGRLLALIVVPVQTLVHQIEKEFLRYNSCCARISSISGAIDFEKELHHLNENGFCRSDIIIATPGRLMEHLTDTRSKIQLNTLRFLIVDEADRMGHMVRAEWLEIVERRTGGLSRTSNLTDTLMSGTAPRKILLSATLSKDVEELHMWNLHRPYLFRATAKKSHEVALDVSASMILPSSIQHTVFSIEQSYHPLFIYSYIEKHNWQRVLVFTNEKDSSLRLSRLLSCLADGKYKVEQLTADLFGNRRIKVLKRFKSGQTRVLISSDVLSRGVDVEGIDCVINYDIPRDDRLFIHRAGRTGRAGKQGVVISLTDRETKRKYLKMLRKNALWVNSIEQEVFKESLEEYSEKYANALEYFRDLMEKSNEDVRERNTVQGKKPVVSGFAYRKVRKWKPSFKESDIANKRRKEKKDF